MSIGAFYFYTEAMGLLQKWSDATEVIGCDGSARIITEVIGCYRLLTESRRRSLTISIRSGSSTHSIRTTTHPAAGAGSRS